MVKAAIYARCSTADKQDPETQLVHLRNLCSQRGFEIVEEYVDMGISGTKDSRPAFDRLRNDALRGRFNVLIVGALDRVGRSLKNVIQTMETFRHQNIQVISLRESIDMTTPGGWAMVQMISVFAELERNLIAERIRSALAAKKSEAKAKGTKWKCGRPSIIDDALVRSISSMRIENVSMRKIAKLLNVSYGTVAKVVSQK